MLPRVSKVENPPRVKSFWINRWRHVWALRAPAVLKLPIRKILRWGRGFYERRIKVTLLLYYIVGAALEDFARENYFRIIKDLNLP